MTHRIPHRRSTIAVVTCLVPFALGGCGAADATGDPPARDAAQGAGQDAAPPREAINSQLPDRPYSQAVRVGDTYWLSGKVGVTDETLAMTDGRTAAETRNVMESFGALLEEMGLGFGDVVQGTVFLADIADYAAMNEVYGEYFPADPPARETVAVKDIVGGAAVEISFVAVAR